MLYEVITIRSRPTRTPPVHGTRYTAIPPPSSPCRRLRPAGFRPLRSIHVMAEFDGCDTGSVPGSNAYDWTNTDNPGDIIAYRLHNQYAATSEQPKQDMVNHPPHYQSDNGVECIDAIRAALGRDGFIAYCRGNAMKYIVITSYSIHYTKLYDVPADPIAITGSISRSRRYIS